MTDQKNKKKTGLRAAFTRAACALTLAAPLAFGAVAMAQDSDEGPAVANSPATEQTVSAPDNGGGFGGIDGIGFALPFLLAGGIALPLIWVLMRQTPPVPAQLRFPAFRLLEKLEPQKETPSTMPIWQKMLAMAAGGLFIAGLAEPYLNPEEPLNGDGPVMIVVDNGWAAARNWDARRNEIDSLIARAENAGRPILFLPTAPLADDTGVHASTIMNADEARAYAETLQPLPWEADRGAALAALDRLQSVDGASVVWLSNGLDGDDTLALAERLQSLGALTVVEDSANDAPRLLVPGSDIDGTVNVVLHRPDGSVEDRVSIVATDQQGRLIERQDLVFAPGETELPVTFDLPEDIQRQVVRVSLVGENSAGATVLRDALWRYRPVGILDNNAPEAAQPLLSEFSFIERALDPYADLSRGNLDGLLAEELAVIILGDSTNVDAQSADRLDDWIREGGTVLRFAGPRLAETQDELLPVELRAGARNLEGGNISTSAPQQIAPFDADSPFAGLNVPDNIRIGQQVLAQPNGDLDERIWARLEDGTPIITAERRGEGLIVLVHTTANTEWSNLALSGFFVDMMRSVIDESAGVNATLSGNTTLPPYRVLDGEGRLVDPPGTIEGLNNDAVANDYVGPRTWPGYYGDGETRRAYNLGDAVNSVAAFPALPDSVTRTPYKEGQQQAMGPWLMAGGAGLFLASWFAMYMMMRARKGNRIQPQTRRDNNNGPRPTMG